MAVLQLFLSMESLLPSDLWFNSLKNFDGLNFPFDFTSSFSPSLWSSAERQVGSSKTWVRCFIQGYILSAFCIHRGEIMIWTRGDTQEYEWGYFLTFASHCGIKKHVFLSLPRQDQIKKKSVIIYFLTQISVNIKAFIVIFHFIYVFICLLFTSACPDPSCWWSGSSVRWGTPAHPSAASPDVDHPESSGSLNEKATESKG